MPPEPGDKAPDFTLVDQDGEPFSLSRSLKQRKAAHFVYFYPKADTPGCTVQACALRDLEGSDGLGDTVVLGISPDAPTKLAKFDEKYGLGFRLLADEDHAVADAYGAWGEKSMYGKKFMGIVRSAVLIAADGKVVEAWPKLSPKDTPTNLVKALTESA